MTERERIAIELAGLTAGYSPLLSMPTPAQRFYALWPSEQDKFLKQADRVIATAAKGCK